jgi:hypothetical protein
MLEKSHGTEEHAERLATLTRETAKSLGLTQSEMDHLELLALLHDIGKVGIPDQISTKPGPLTPDEWDVMKKHPEIGLPDRDRFPGNSSRSRTPSSATTSVGTGTGIRSSCPGSRSAALPNPGGHRLL